MSKTTAILSVIIIILCFDCIAMTFRIKAQEAIIESQKDEIRSERDACRIYERRCDSLFNELTKKDDEDGNDSEIPL